MPTGFEILNLLVIIIVILLLVVIILMFIVILVRNISDNSIKEKTELFNNLESKIFEYLEGNDHPSKLILNLKSKEYKYLLQLLRPYLTSLKGSDYNKIADIINKTKINNYLIKRLDGLRTKHKVEAAYYLGLARSQNAKTFLIKKLYSRNDQLFFTCALSLAKINEIKAVGTVVSRLEKHQLVSKDFIIMVLLEFGIDVCQSLDRILTDKSPDRLKSIIISVLGHFKYYESAPKILNVLTYTGNNSLRIDCINALSNMEYLEALPTLKRLLYHPKPEIRVETIKAINKIGDLTLEAKLIEKIYDDDWHVQYEAARTIINFPGNGRLTLSEITKNKKDRSAAAIAEMVLEENNLWDSIEYT